MSTRREIDGDAMWRAKQAKAAHNERVKLAKIAIAWFIIGFLAFLALVKCAA